MASVSAETTVQTMNFLLCLYPYSQSRMLDVMHNYFTLEIVGSGDEGSDTAMDSDTDDDTETRIAK